ncbi:uncharacterized protein Bfra_011298 [Botrytis fragariae]|uniref:Uncharacterized protein n=1 Tax=Botrytis fragariae TaxID=1964551 RepID=A0A8H6EEL3_9HELO|nr:uncharacterized protein Bfra_011298 [Botrytis fragariae]KAF5869489.1 hypothetical protein Bfra_011298 [Botrytis fragariae]
MVSLVKTTNHEDEMLYIYMQVSGFGVGFQNPNMPVELRQDSFSNISFSQKMLLELMFCLNEEFNAT